MNKYVKYGIISVSMLMLLAFLCPITFLFVLSSYEINGKSASYEKMTGDFFGLKNYEIPLDEMKNGSEYFYHFEKGMDHFLVIRYTINNSTLVSLRSNKKYNWGRENIGIIFGSVDWYYDYNRNDLRYSKTDQYSYWVLDESGKFVYFVQFST